MIMFAGKARVGKTDAAKLASKFLYDMNMWPLVRSFAAPIKDMAAQQGYTKEDTPDEYRLWMQKNGAAKRAEDPDYWLNKWKETLPLEGNEDQVVLVDDCRYMNEVAAGRDNDALIIFIHPGHRDLEEQDAEWRNHESEDLANNVFTSNKNYMDIFQHLIFNAGTKGDLQMKIDRILLGWLTDGVCTCDLCMLKGNKVGEIIEELSDLCDS
jgi:hypothetical protein